MFILTMVISHTGRQKDIDPIHEEESREENVEPTTIGRLPLIIVGSNNPVADQVILEIVLTKWNEIR